MPTDNSFSMYIPERKTNDNVVNPFGRKLLSLCKDNDMHILNGRLENGEYTYLGKHRNKICSSIIDYVITNYNNIKYIEKFEILELNEFSDHRPLVLHLNLKFTVEEKPITYDKIVWDKERLNELYDNLNNRKEKFDAIIMNIKSDIDKFDDNILKFSQEIYDCSFNVFGKTVNKTINKNNVKKSKVKMV